MEKMTDIAEESQKVTVTKSINIPQSAESLVRHGTTLSLLTLISRILGLVREMVKARFLGTTALSDAFSVAFLLPNLFRRLFAEGSISVAFIPTFKEYLLEENREKAQQAATREFLSCMFTFLTFFVTLMVMAGILAAPFLVRIFGIEEFDETVLLTRIMFPFLGFISLAALFQGVLNSLHIFTPSGLAPILLNIVTILCAYFLSPCTANPARAMAIGIFIGGFLEAAIQLPFVIKKGQTFFITGLKRAFNNPGVRKVLRLISPTIIGMAAYQINDLVSTALAGRAGEGVVSSLQYSLRLQELFLGVFAVSIGTVMLPNLAEYAKTSQWEIYSKRLVSSIKIIALITIPVTFFSLLEGQALIRLLFQSRSFDEQSVALTLAAFTFHMPGLLFIALNRVIAPAFYAQSDTKSPTVAGIISFAVNITLAAVLVGPFRGAGIAFALTAASAVNTVVLIAFLKRNPNIDLGIAPSVFYILKIIFLSVIASVPVFFISPVLREMFAGLSRVFSIGAPLLVCAAVYLLLGIVMLAIIKDENFTGIVNIIKKRKNK
ncbi:MAG: murein biosynthesis integral membrane protein MurJ [Treponema sp.]|nr:murein biosynthesis integral membrane protein MurJ [Treponema sp.]MCL2272699.1 murein biosynthesis integral membrane protein MurJ [Treponema sp.]